MKKICLSLLIFLFVLLFTNSFSIAEEEAMTAIGFNAGFGGIGLSYKKFFDQDKGIQVTGFIFGDSNEAIYY